MAFNLWLAWRGHAPIYDGIYDLLESTRKVVLVSGLNIDGTEYKDMFLNFGVVGSEFHAIIIFDITNTLLITINDNDIVTITQQIAVTQLSLFNFYNKRTFYGNYTKSNSLRRRGTFRHLQTLR